MSHSSLAGRIRRDPLILPFYLPALIMAFSQGLLVPILPLYAGSFGVSYALIGLLLAGEPLGMVLSDLPAGVLLRRMGNKGSTLLGMGCIILSTVALFWARSIPEALAYRLVAGFGAALYNVSRHSYVASATVVRNRGKALALFGGIFRLGSFVGPAVGGVVATAYGLRVPFVLVGGTAIVALVIAAAFLRATPQVPPATQPMSGSLRSHLSLALKARYRVLATAGSAHLLAQTIRAGRRVIIPLYAADVVGLDVRAIGFIVSISSAVDMSLSYPTGVIMDRLGRKFAIVPSFLIQALGMALVPLTGTFASLLAAASLIGLGNGLGSGTMMTLGADLAPEEARGEFLGMWRLIGDAGSTGGPLAVGAIAELLALHTSIWVISGIGLAAAMVFLFLVPETLKKRYHVLTPG